MATIRRAGFGTVFELEDSKVGIGTDAATHTLQALGNIRSEDATDIGISSLTTYQGFVDKGARFTTGQIDNQSQSGATSGEIVIDGDVTVSSATTFTSGPQHLTVTDTFTLPSGDTNSRELKPTAGSLRFNQDFATLEFYTGNNWATVNTFTEMQNSPGNRGRAVWAGGYDSGGVPSSTTSRIDFMNIHTQGNSKRFGDLTSAGQDGHGSGNAERGIFQGRFSGNTINYITIASEGNGIDFGDMFTGRYYCTSVSSSTRSVTMGGLAPTTPASNVIEYIQIMTLGNALDFGDMVRGRVTDGSGFGNSVEGFYCGGHPANNPDYEVINIASTGSAITEGNVAIGTRWPGGGCSNSTRGIWAGGADVSSDFTSTITFLNMSSKGNSQFFGDLSQKCAGTAGAASNQTRAVIPFGSIVPAYTEVNSVEYITISTGGNAKDFGDLRGGENDIHTRHISPLSDSHGGLGGF